MAIDFAMVLGFTGSGNSAPAWNALTTGAEPAACTACMRGRSPLTQPSVLSSSNARPMRGSSVPPATGQTTWRGKRQPSCSAISKP